MRLQLPVHAPALMHALCATLAQGLEPLPGHSLADGETTTRGLQELAAAAAGYRAAGARFAKCGAA